MKKLTTKQKKFTKAVIEGKTATDAVIEAGYEVKDRQNASVIGSENLSLPKIQQALGTVLDALDINMYRATKPISDALDATKAIVHGKDSEDSWIDEVPDHAIRLAAGKQARDLIDKLATDETPPSDLFKGLTPNMDEVELTERIFKGKMSF